MPEQPGIYFKEAGKGFPVILIHGFCENHTIWDSFSEKLSREFRVLSIDLPGFGQSPLLSTPFSINDVATKILMWLKNIGINQSILIGHSLGGYVSLAMVHQRPTIFKGFSLFHSTAFADSEEKKLSRNKVIEFVSTNGVKPFIESFVPPLFYDQTNPHIASIVSLGLETKKETLIAYTAAMRDRPDRTETIRQFDGNILFLAGEKDGVVAPELLEKQSTMAKNPSFKVLKNVAHMGMFENEDEALRCTLDFLRL